MSFHVRKSLALAAAVLVTAALGAGCSGSSNKSADSKPGSVKVSVDASAVSADIDHITLTIDDHQAAPRFNPITVPLTRTGSVWTANVTSIPAAAAPGSPRYFTAIAYTSGGVAIFRGETPVTVIAGQLAEVTINLIELNPAPGPDAFAPRITALTTTSTYVLPGQAGSASVTAVDPNAGAVTGSLGYLWSAQCTAGTMAFGTPTASSTTWTAPAGDAICTVAIRVTESTTTPHLSVTTWFTITVNSQFGDVNVVAIPNSYPVITVGADMRYNFFASVTTMGVGQQGDFFFHATDPDGDDVRFDLSGACTDATQTPPVAAGPVAANFSAITLIAPTPADFNPTFGYGGSAVAYTNPNSDCRFEIDVQDLCTAGNCTSGRTGTQGGLPNGADKVALVNGVTVKSVTKGYINTTHPAQPLRAPNVVRVVAPNQNGAAAVGVQTWDPKNMAVVAPSTKYSLQAEASDPEGGTLTAAWNCVNGTPGTQTDTVSNGDLVSLDTWTSPASLTVGMACTVTFTSSVSHLATAATFQFQSSDTCVGAPDNTPCNDGNACTVGESCQGGHCTAPTTVCHDGQPCTGGTITCDAASQCQVGTSGTCNPLNGTCSYAARTNGTVCALDTDGCTVDTCQAGACTAGGPFVCNAANGYAPPNAYCYGAVGQCTSLSSTTHACTDVPASTATTCTAANATAKCNGANTFTAFACDGAGACVGSGSAACQNTTCASGNSCQSASGQCGGGSNQPVTTPCDDGNGCTTGDHCDGNGLCTGGQGCSPGQSCNGTACASTDVVPTAGYDLQISPPSALAMDDAGNTFAAGLIFTNVDVNFQNVAGQPPINLHSLAGQDIFVARYNASGAIAWARDIGDDDPAGNPADQNASGVAVTNNGTVVIYGKAGGAVTFGANTVGTASGVPFMAGLNGATGASLWANQYNLGNNGYFRSIASNPHSAANRVVICGQANVAVTSLVPGAVWGGGGPSITDIVIASFDVSTTPPTRVWSTQIGGTGTESCNAVAVDDAGDVYATGWFDTATVTFPGATPVTITGPGTATRKALWVAKFAGAGNGSGGASVLRAVSYTGSLGNANPSTIATSPDGDVWVAGQYTGDITFGGVCPALPAPPGVDCLTEAGGGDGFFAKLDGTSLAPVFQAGRIGGTGNDQVKSVAVTSFGDAVMVGTFNPSSAAFRAANGGNDTTGAAGLVGSGSSDMLSLKIDGLTGATQFAHAYGNNLNQNGDAVAVNRYGANQIAIFATNVGNTTFGPAGVVPANGGTDAALLFAHLQ